MDDSQEGLVRPASQRDGVLIRTLAQPVEAGMECFQVLGDEDELQAAVPGPVRPVDEVDLVHQSDQLVEADVEVAHAALVRRQEICDVGGLEPR